MHDAEYTLSSPISDMAANSAPVLCATIVWHPDLARVGEQFLGNTGSDVLELSRYLPLFQRPGGEGRALGYGGVSREPLQLRQRADGDLDIMRPASRMAVEINGAEMGSHATLTQAEVANGAIVGLGGAVLLCLHWMACLPKHNPVPALIGVGQAAIRMRDLIRQVATSDATVLLLGETGTGKEVAARAIHTLSERATLPLVTVNMAALNESLAAADLFGAAKGAYTGAQNARAGLFAQAQDATLFLDEVGNTPVAVQPMLLRVLESGDYRPLGASHDQRASARLIAATDQDLYGEAFSQALLRRLEGFVIPIPPLRARREDIGLLLVDLLQQARADVSLPASLVVQFATYDWPGNVRQLKHVLKRVVLALQMGEVPDFATLVDRAPARAGQRAHEKGTPPPSAGAAGQAEPSAARKRLTDLSEADVLAAMEANDWYIQAAAQALGISRPSMYKLLEAHTRIRRPEQIDAELIRATLAQNGGDVELCAGLLKTPSEALRRHLRVLGI